jgi:hypothetical protein
LSIDEGIEATTVRAKGDAAMSGVPTKHLVSYVVYNLQSNAIFLTNLRSEQREYLIHALGKVSHVDDLIQVLMKKFSEVVLRCKLQYAQLAGRNLGMYNQPTYKIEISLLTLRAQMHYRIWY